MGNKEVRDILMGRIVQKNEQFWTAAPSDAKFRFHGIKDGAGDVRLFGVTHLTQRCGPSEMESDAAFAEVEAALYSMGRPVLLASLPKSKGCLYAPNWIAPVLLTVEQENDGLKMTAYTGRSLLIGHFRCRIALWLLKQRLPERITGSGKNEKADRTSGQRENTPKREHVAKNEKTVKREGKRTALPKKGKTTPKRLMK